MKDGFLKGMTFLIEHNEQGFQWDCGAINSVGKSGEVGLGWRDEFIFGLLGLNSIRKMGS